jgi:ABC-2 type transport system ATP-binding protein
VAALRTAPADALAPDAPPYAPAPDAASVGRPASGAIDAVPAVALAGVAKSFGDVAAVRDLSLVVPQGTVTVLLGPNGAGKTTTVRLVTGALVADAGTIRVFGLDPLGDGTAVRLRCGVVPPKPSLYIRLNGHDNLRYASEICGLGWGADARARAQRAAEQFGIDHALGQKVVGYSTGMRTRLALARAVLHDPDLLLLDEPTAGLDPESARAVLALITDLAARGKTVVVCTHLLHEAEGLADQVVLVDHGRAMAAGPPAELARRLWPECRVVISAEEPHRLDVLADQPGVVAYRRDGDADGRATLDLDRPERVPDLVAGLVDAGVRVTRVQPLQPSLEELYFALQREAAP